MLGGELLLGPIQPQVFYLLQAANHRVSASRVERASGSELGS
ncbi:hypothetical protein IYQ_21930 [Aeromonas salmonicida subsp. salmonicida 01-B526]|uniref:Uncharacterized protein n=1 Tax=Aeromonas salmonicida subsp. salmonicida 01-B526 TaxID=1076135 RepID=A0ABN0DU19_AERSS|nr:hypothetical protein IYQ_21930 [Aeromonas salmonicida subsp. salmonicida 01-B526]